VFAPLNFLLNFIIPYNDQIYFVTGGVTSSLGKGIIAASLANYCNRGG
jgi:hypothetical protein